MTKTVLVRSCTRLACSSQESPEVVLCLINDTLLASGRTTLDGVISKSYKEANPCDCNCNPRWTYLVDYDNTLLTDPDTALTTAEVSGIFCKGCMTTWIEELIAEALGS